MYFRLASGNGACRYATVSHSAYVWFCHMEGDQLLPKQQTTPAAKLSALGCASRGDTFGWSAHLLAKAFCLWVSAWMWLCSEVGQVELSASEFWREKCLSPLSGLLVPCTGFAHQLWCGMCFTSLTLMEWAQVDRAWSPAHYFSHGVGLQSAAGHGWVAPREPPGTVPWQQPLTAKPILGSLLKALHGIYEKLMCELGALIRTVALCTFYLTKVRMQMQHWTSVPP